MRYLVSLFFIALASSQITGCQKDSDSFPGTNIIPGAGNTAPHANAGEDLVIWSPLNDARLRGSWSDKENNIKEVSWEKISGPDSYMLEDKHSLSTKITGLEEGTYEFELTVTDMMNLSDKDRVTVTVGGLSTNPNEIIFNDLVWIFPWYNNVEIKNFVNNTTSGRPFKIFIQRDHDLEWKEVPPTNNVTLPVDGLYDYFIITGLHSFYSEGSLYISYYGSDVDDTPNVKIVY